MLGKKAIEISFQKSSLIKSRKINNGNQGLIERNKGIYQQLVKTLLTKVTNIARKQQGKREIPRFFVRKMKRKADKTNRSLAKPQIWEARLPWINLSASAKIVNKLLIYGCWIRF